MEFQKGEVMKRRVEDLKGNRRRFEEKGRELKRRTGEKDRRGGLERRKERGWKGGRKRFGKEGNGLKRRKEGWKGG